MPPSLRDAAGRAVTVLQQNWYRADTFAAEAGVWRYDDPDLASSIGQAAADAIHLTGSSWYVTIAEDCARWWNYANTVTALCDYMAVTGDHALLGDVEFTLQNASQHVGSFEPQYSLSDPTPYSFFLNDFYDDEGWWALAHLAAYELTHDAGYLGMARFIFDDMTGGWNDQLNGGLLWQRNGKDPAGNAGPYKNAIANELFLAVAAALHLATGDQQYLDWAQREWAWFQQTGLIAPAGIAGVRPNLINDSIDEQFGVNLYDTPVWTYNQGVILRGLCDLHRITGDRSLLRTAERIADAMITNTVVATTTYAVEAQSGVVDGILWEWDDATPTSIDARQFKGIFVRNLAYLYAHSHQPRYRRWILRNAQSVAFYMETDFDDQIGARWNAPASSEWGSTLPFGSSDFIRQTAGIDLLNAALVVQKAPIAYLAPLLTR